MLGKNLPLNQVCHDPAINNIPIGIGTLGDVHIDTLVLSWACMGGVLLAALAVRPALVSNGPGGPLQAMAEGLYNFVDDLAHGAIGHGYKKYLPLIAAIFIFVLTGNFIGIAPWVFFEKTNPDWFHYEKHIGGHEVTKHWEVASPTTDFNVTLGLAAIAVLVYIFAGLAVHGGKYAKLLVFNPIEWLDLIIRPSTLSLRLLLVITADEITRLVAVILVPWLVPTGVMAFEMFIGIIQAFVFAILTAIYIGGATAEHH